MEQGVLRDGESIRLIFNGPVRRLDLDGKCTYTVEPTWLMILTPAAYREQQSWPVRLARHLWERAFGRKS